MRGSPLVWNLPGQTAELCSTYIDPEHLPLHSLELEQYNDMNHLCVYQHVARWLKLMRMRPERRLGHFHSTNLECTSLSKLSFVVLFYTLTTDFKLNNRIYAKTVIFPFEIRWRGIKKRIYPATFHTTLCYQAFTCHPLYPSLRSRRRRPFLAAVEIKVPFSICGSFSCPDILYRRGPSSLK